MEQAIQKYQNCLNRCGKGNSCVCTYVCQDKFRNDLGKFAMKTGENTLLCGKTVQWPYMSPIPRSIPKYITVEDMDGLRNAPQGPVTPFTTPKEYINSGCVGENNRAYPYSHLYRGGYGSLMKFTVPSVRDPIYY